MVKSASFTIYFAHSTSFRIFRSSTEGIKEFLIISRKECQRGEFKVREEVVRRCTKAPCRESLTVPRHINTQHAQRCATCHDRATCWFVADCASDVAWSGRAQWHDRATLFRLHDLKFSRVCFKDYLVFSSHTLSQAILGFHQRFGLSSFVLNSLLRRSIYIYLRIN